MSISNVIKITVIIFFRDHFQFALIAYQKEYYWMVTKVCSSLSLMILADFGTKASLHTVAIVDAVTE